LIPRLHRIVRGDYSLSGRKSVSTGN